jgi:molybdate transport system substrate-binding protein
MQRVFPFLTFPVLLAGCSKPSEKIIVATAANVQYV